MTSPNPSAKSLWARTRQAAYTEITAAAVRLFLEQGFEATTIDQIASECGISRRSLFRYFGTKEDILLGDLEKQGVVIQAALEARPLSEDPWEALRAALSSAQNLNRSPEETLKLSTLLYETPSLRARSIQKHLKWKALLVPNVRQRLGGDHDDHADVRADAIVACVLACLDVAGETWVRSNGTIALEELYDAAVHAIRN